jgi:hypothetical protein
MLQDDALREGATTEVAPLFDPIDPDLGFPPEHLGQRWEIIEKTPPTS